MPQTLAICAHRDVSIATFGSVISLLAKSTGWSLLIETGDALISRSRSIAVSRWLRECPQDDVLLMTDDDFLFTPEGAQACVDLAREKQGIVAGVTPLRGGEYTAIVPLGMTFNDDRTPSQPWLSPDCEPLEIKWAGGFLAYHRRVFETLSKTLPLLHAKDTIPAFWPFFMPAVAEMNGRGVYLSEDYACHERARKAGFAVWVQPKAQVGHVANITVSSQNMAYIRQAVAHIG